MSELKIITEDNERTFDDREDFENTKDLLDDQGVDYEIENGSENGQGSNNQENGHENGHEPVEAELVEPEPETRTEPLPAINDVEETIRNVINQLDASDMNRLVWDPNADPESVPYKVRGLPYDSPEPSAEAFDLFATIIESVLDVEYSVVEAEFSRDDETLEATVIIEKQSGDRSKRLVGVKTRELSKTQGLDHWRERLYSKARRNALKQDIPPTYVSALLDRFNQLHGGM